MKALMTLAEAAGETPYGVGVLRKAIHTTDPHSWPPPLRAKRGSRGQYTVTEPALRAWIDSLEDA